MKKCGLQIVAAVLIGVVLSSCSARSQVISEWRNPAYGLANFKRILVSGPGFATSVRRNFEDEFVAQLRPMRRVSYFETTLAYINITIRFV